MASTSPPGPTIFSHFLIFSLLSSPRSMKSYWCYTHTKNMCFYLPSGLHNFSQQYFSVLLQNRLFSQEFSMSLFWFKVDWKTIWKKRALFLVSMLEEKKKKGREIDTKISIKNNISYFHSNKKEENYQHILPFHLLFLGQFYWRIFVYIHLTELLYIPNALRFQKQPPTNTHAHFLHYHLKSTTELTNYQEYIWRYHF